MNTTFSIWYAKPEQRRREDYVHPTDLEQTHVHVKDLVLPGGENQLERVFHDMQAEIWSPNGEACDLIESKGLWHTSMSMGDIVVVNGAVYEVASFGFKTLKEPCIFECPLVRG